MNHDEKELWQWVFAIAIYGVVLQVSASSVATGKIGSGPDPQFISVDQSTSKSVELPKFSTSAPKLTRCPGQQPVWSFECQPVRGQNEKR